MSSSFFEESDFGHGSEVDSLNSWIFAPGKIVKPSLLLLKNRVNNFNGIIAEENLTSWHEIYENFRYCNVI